MNVSEIPPPFFAITGSLEDLGTGTLALDDAAVDLDVVAYVENGNVLLELLTCKSLDNILDGSS